MPNLHSLLRSCTANTLVKFQVLDERRPAIGKIPEMQMIWGYDDFDVDDDDDDDADAQG